MCAFVILLLAPTILSCSTWLSAKTTNAPAYIAFQLAVVSRPMCYNTTLVFLAFLLATMASLLLFEPKKKHHSNKLIIAATAFAPMCMKKRFFLLVPIC